MRILIDLTSLADNFSGIERYAASISREMLSCKEHTFIFLFKDEIHTMFLDYKDAENVEMIVIPRCKKLIFNQVKLPLEIYRHTADWYLFMAFPVPLLLFKKNMVSTIHDICCWDCPETMNGMSKWYFRISHRVAVWKCKRIITISQFSQERIVQKLRYPREKIWLIYCGVDEQFIKYAYNDAKASFVREKYHLPQQYLLSLSTLEPRKNLRLLVEAYRKVVLDEKIDTPLVLAGRRGWKMDKLLEGIEDAVKEKIHFTGFIDEEDLPEVYGNAKCFIFPSMYEGFGIPPLEAMACGTPVLSSDATSLPEVLSDTALYFENENVVELMNEMCVVLESNENVAIAVNKRFQQIQKFKWDEHASRLIKMLLKER